jgi:3-oxoacyl-[acyl-carrier protein] reductase
MVVTGAGGGIGRATAVALASHGAAVLCTDIDADGLETTGALIEQAAPSAQVASEVLDCTDYTAASAVLSRCSALWSGTFDALVNVAGIILAKPLAECELADLERVFRVNVGGILVMSRAVLPHLSGSAVILNVTSNSARQVTPGLGIYGASKAANSFLTRALALELAERGARVCAIAPGAVNTKMPRSILPPGEDGDRILEQAISNSQLIKHLAQPEDVAGAICFLLSDAAAFVTGSTLWFDGGSVS